MRGKLAKLFGWLTLLFLIAALATPWFKWNNEQGFQPGGGDRVTCWIDATCRTNGDDNSMIFKGGYRAQRFYDATLMLLVIPGVLMFLPILWMIHKLNNSASADSRLKGGLARALILLFGLITLLSWIAALIVFPLGVRDRYRPCDFQSNIPQWVSLPSWQQVLIQCVGLRWSNSKPTHWRWKTWWHLWTQRPCFPSGHHYYWFLWKCHQHHLHYHSTRRMGCSFWMVLGHARSPLPYSHNSFWSSHEEQEA